MSDRQESYPKRVVASSSTTVLLGSDPTAKPAQSSSSTQPHHPALLQSVHSIEAAVKGAEGGLDKIRDMALEMRERP